MVTITTAQHIPQFENEAGGHRIQRIPPTEKRGRVHTSTVTVSVLNEQRRTTPHDQRTRDDFEYRWFSGTGKGGQHRNKHQNCLELTHIPTGLKQIANGRSRDSNEREAMMKLTQVLDSYRDQQNGIQVNQIRAAQIGCGMRGDKRRTYRFQDDQVVDHVSGKKMTTKRFMRGDIEQLWE